MTNDTLTENGSLFSFSHSISKASFLALQFSSFCCQPSQTKPHRLRVVVAILCEYQARVAILYFGWLVLGGQVRFDGTPSKGINDAPHRGPHSDLSTWAVRSLLCLTNIRSQPSVSTSSALGKAMH
jgi:hypothetical protein